MASRCTKAMPITVASTLMSSAAVIVVLTVFSARCAPPGALRGSAHAESSSGSLRRLNTVIPNENYEVSFNGTAKTVFENYCQSDTMCKEKWVNGTNNFASFTMASAPDGGYEAVTVRVKSYRWSAALGVGFNLRPSYYQSNGYITDVDTSKLQTGVVTFKVHAPCQLSVEIGDEGILFADKDSQLNFANLILAFNPPESEWPQAKPTLMQLADGSWVCNSADPDRSCVLATTDASCQQYDIGGSQDLYFSSVNGMTYTWGDGCGSSPKQIRLKYRSRVFLDEDVVVHARFFSTFKKVGIYGYGVISNFYMGGVKDKSVAKAFIALEDKSSEVFGVTVLDSTHRNIWVGEMGKVSWTKSFAWNTETDCVVATPGLQVHNNFFKVKDDCLKTYYPGMLYADNIIWKGRVGRAIMLSWGNKVEPKQDIDSTTQVRDTFIIHDDKAFSTMTLNEDWPESIARHVKSTYYGSIISAQHSMDNTLGLATSPIVIDGLHVESGAGMLLAVTTGYEQINGLAPWQRSNGCAGGINLQLKNVNLTKVTSWAEKSFLGGCETDSSYIASHGIEGSDCLCTSALACPAESCSVDVQLIAGQNSQEAADMQANLLLGPKANLQHIIA
mmetsp:Transcript_31605/g.73710  ORF Transcript_31605/g.73710 Transcript_31605/m.73710 type:complete len:616 (+) Transcript_31605:59-1906(+)